MRVRAKQDKDGENSDSDPSCSGHLSLECQSNTRVPPQNGELARGSELPWGTHTGPLPLPVRVLGGGAQDHRWEESTLHRAGPGGRAGRRQRFLDPRAEACLSSRQGPAPQVSSPEGNG